jgi:hypothetical protein
MSLLRIKNKTKLRIQAKDKFGKGAGFFREAKQIRIFQEKKNGEGRAAL